MPSPPPLLPITVLRGHTCSVSSVLLFSKDDTISNSSPDLELLNLASGDVNGELILWDLNTRRPHYRIEHAHNNHSIQTILYSNDNQLILSSGRDGWLRSWDVENGIIQHEYQTNCEHFCNMAQLDSNVFLTSNQKDKVLLWDLRVASAQDSFEAPENSGMITSIATPSSNSLSCFAMGLESGSVSLVDYRMNEILFTENINPQPIMSVEFSPNNKTLIAGGGEVQLTSFKLKIVKEEELEVEEDTVEEVFKEKDIDKANPSTSSNSSLSNSLSSSISSFKPSLLSTLLSNSPSNLNQPTNNNEKNTREDIKKVEFKENKLRIKSFKIKDQLNLPSLGTSSIKFRNDGRIFATSHWDGTIKLWNKKFNLIANIDYHKETILNLSFYNSFLASSCKDHLISIWNPFISTYKYNKEDQDQDED